METVEVVIKIPKQDFDFIIDEFAEGNMPDKKDLKETIYYAIANGTVLPKGHGRLIDSEYMKKIDSIQRGDFNSIESIRNWIDIQPTIIEADKEET